MRQEERRARTRRALDLAARRAFARGGYSETSIDRIAADAGVSKGALYAHYPTKLDLFLAVTDTVLADARGRVERVSRAVAEGRPAANAARRYLEDREDAEHVSLMAEIWRLAVAEERVRERLEAFRRERIAAIGQGAVDAGKPPRAALAEAELVAKLIDAETLEHRLAAIVNL